MRGVLLFDLLLDWEVFYCKNPSTEQALFGDFEKLHICYVEKRIKKNQTQQTIKEKDLGNYGDFSISLSFPMDKSKTKFLLYSHIWNAVY